MPDSLRKTVLTAEQPLYNRQRTPVEQRRFDVINAAFPRSEIPKYKDTLPGKDYDRVYVDNETGLFVFHDKNGLDYYLIRKDRETYTGEVGKEVDLSQFDKFTEEELKANRKKTYSLTGKEKSSQIIFPENKLGNNPFASWQERSRAASRTSGGGTSGKTVLTSESPAETKKRVLPYDGGPVETMMKGVEIKALQTKLLSMGFEIGPDGADGLYGGNTKKAVMEYQKYKGLTPNGVVDESVWRALGL